MNVSVSSHDDPRDCEDSDGDMTDDESSYEGIASNSAQSAAEYAAEPTLSRPGSSRCSNSRSSSNGAG